MCGSLSLPIPATCALWSELRQLSLTTVICDRRLIYWVHLLCTQKQTYLEKSKSKGARGIPGERPSRVSPSNKLKLTCAFPLRVLGSSWRRTVRSLLVLLPQPFPAVYSWSSPDAQGPCMWMFHWAPFVYSICIHTAITDATVLEHEKHNKDKNKTQKPFFSQ